MFFESTGAEKRTIDYQLAGEVSQAQPRETEILNPVAVVFILYTPSITVAHKIIHQNIFHTLVDCQATVSFMIALKVSSAAFLCLYYSLLFSLLQICLHLAALLAMICPFLHRFRGQRRGQDDKEASFV